MYHVITQLGEGRKCLCCSPSVSHQMVEGSPRAVLVTTYSFFSEILQRTPLLRHDTTLKNVPNKHTLAYAFDRLGPTNRPHKKKKIPVQEWSDFLLKLQEQNIGNL